MFNCLFYNYLFIVNYKRLIMIIYKRSFTQRLDTTDNITGLQWFSFDKNYGSDSYGNILTCYKMSNKINLLDIGLMINRENIINKIKSTKELSKKWLNPEYILDADEQYSGGKANKLAHLLIKDVVGDTFDGTIINSEYCDSELKGASEIVLWNANFIKKIDCNNFSKKLK